VWKHLRLIVDIAATRLFLWAAGGNADLLDAHAFFYDRYSGLAEHHRAKGRTRRAERCARIAETHWRAMPDGEEPPRAVAMAMPVPRPPVRTNAVSKTRLTVLSRREH
jgi:hypothetical protein